MSLTKFKEFLKKYKAILYVIGTVLIVIVVSLIEKGNTERRLQPKTNTSGEQGNERSTTFSKKETVNSVTIEQSIIPGYTSDVALGNTFGTPIKIETNEKGLVYKDYNLPNSVTGVLHVVANYDGEVRFYSYTPIKKATLSEYEKTYSLGEPEFFLDPETDDDVAKYNVYLTRGVALLIGQEGGVHEVWRFIPTDRDTFLYDYMTKNYAVIENTPSE